MGVEARVRVFHGDFYRQEKRKNPFGRTKNCRTVVHIHYEQFSWEVEAEDLAKCVEEIEALCAVIRIKYLNIMSTANDG